MGKGSPTGKKKTLLGSKVLHFREIPFAIKESLLSSEGIVYSL